ncbi:hypothetical protein OG21DRAFT_764056 [Imleria badia]|nr:hypothetical protein OG21DRAFT_764056 [Imleria badia]
MATHRLFIAINRQWVWQVTMRMEEPTTMLSEVVREFVCSEFSQNRRSIRRTVVVVIRVYRARRAGGGNSINIRFVIVLQIVAVIQFNRHDQLGGGSDCCAVCSMPTGFDGDDSALARQKLDAAATTEFYTNSNSANQSRSWARGQNKRPC